MIPLPNIASFTPTSGGVGTVVTITGTGLDIHNVREVLFSGVPARFDIVSAGVKAIVPQGATTGRITIWAADGTVKSDTDFTVPGTPHIASFSPTNGKVSDKVTITGENLIGTTKVTFNGVSANFIINSDTQVTATVPTGAATGVLALTTATGTNPGPYNYTVLPLPNVSGINPASGLGGTRVTLTGVGFTTTTDVKFNGITATFDIINDTSLSVVIPNLTTTGPFTITSAGGTSTSAGSFAVVNYIDSVDPYSGIPGDTVTFRGVDFSKLQSIAFNGTEAFFSVVNSTTVTAVVPSGAATGKITLTYSDGTVVSNNDFVIYQPVVITSFAPHAGAAGSTVTISGFGFTGTSSVTFNGKTATFTVKNDGLITAAVPSGATTGYITVTNPDGPATTADVFTVYKPTSLPVVVALDSSYLGSISNVSLQYQLAGPQTYSGTLHLSNTGSANLSNLQPGNYTLKISGSHWLTRKISGINVNCSVTANTTLTNGDADGDNQVNLFDIVALDSNFGKVNTMADLDGSGSVNLFDYVIIDQNFGAIGD